MNKKEVTLPLAVAITAMSAMLGTQQAQILRIPGETGITLAFNFAAKQMFQLNFAGTRLTSGVINLVEGREPTNTAMSAVQNYTSTDTVSLFEGLLSGDMVSADIVNDDGFSLSSDDSGVSLSDIFQMSAGLSKIIQLVLDMDIEPTQNAGDLANVEELRSHLAVQFGNKLAA
jgi:hypothetical protein